MDAQAQLEVVQVRRRETGWRNPTLVRSRNPSSRHYIQVQVLNLGVSFLLPNAGGTCGGAAASGAPVSQADAQGGGACCCGFGGQGELLWCARDLGGR